MEYLDKILRGPLMFLGKSPPSDMTLFWRSENYGISLPTTEGGRKHLPQPRGPHSVGYVDLMTPGDPSMGSFVRILYPTKEQCLSNEQKWPIWAEDDYLTGFVKFVQAMSTRWPSWAPKDEFYGAKLSYLTQYLPSTGFSTLFRLMNGRIFVPIIENAAPDTSQKWPVIIFSHGLGCSRTIYSRVCYDLASYGFIVAAVEHRDGTACTSYWLDEAQPRTRNCVPHRWLAPEEDEYEQRNKQVRHRADEVSRVLDLMTRLNEADGGVKNLLDIHHAFSLSQFANIMDLSRPGICGHSFGGATTCMALATDERLKFGVALDAWLFPIRDEPIGKDLKQPIYFLSADSFRSKENLSKMSEFRLSPEQASEAGAVDRRFQYIKGSVHQNTLDAPFVFQFMLVKKFVGLLSKTCPEKVIDLNEKLTVQYIWRMLGMEKDAEVDSDIAKMGYLLDELKFPVVAAGVAARAAAANVA